MSEWPWDILGDEQELWGSALEEPRALHEAWMLEHYGRRDPRWLLVPTARLDGASGVLQWWHRDHRG